ncbi:MAG: hypothetical protein WCP97_08785 [bacterium]
MYSAIIGSILITILLAYFVAFPLTKKRAVILRPINLTALLVALSIAVYAVTSYWIGVFVLVVGLVLFALKPWFVFGLTEEMITQALKKAAQATRATCEKSSNRTTLCASVTIRQHCFTTRTALLTFRKKEHSKKAQLTKVVFRKFMQNYFIR